MTTLQYPVWVNGLAIRYEITVDGAQPQRLSDGCKNPEYVTKVNVLHEDNPPSNWSNQTFPTTLEAAFWVFDNVYSM